MIRQLAMAAFVAAVALPAASFALPPPGSKTPSKYTRAATPKPTHTPCDHPGCPPPAETDQ